MDKFLGKYSIIPFEITKKIFDLAKFNNDVMYPKDIKKKNIYFENEYEIYLPNLGKQLDYNKIYFKLKLIGEDDIYIIKTLLRYKCLDGENNFIRITRSTFQSIDDCRRVSIRSFNDNIIITTIGRYKLDYKIQYFHKL